MCGDGHTRRRSFSRVTVLVFPATTEFNQYGHLAAGMEVEEMLEILKSLRRDESGQDLIEYALVAALIALAAVASMNTVAQGILDGFNYTSNELNSALG